jgi:hypothetical protein
MADVKITAGVNRYYVLQIIVHGKGSKAQYEMFRHDGRTGQKEEEVNWRFSEDWKSYPYGTDKAGCIEYFKQWFNKKTANEWDQRHDFVSRPGQYNFVELSTVNKVRLTTHRVCLD